MARRRVFSRGSTTLRARQNLARNHVRSGRCADPARTGRVWARIARLRKQSVSQRGGQMVSSSPASTRRSTPIRRASSRPRIFETRMRARRPAQDAFADQRVKKRGIAFGVKGENRVGRPAPVRRTGLERLAVFAAGKHSFVAGDDQAERLLMRGEPGISTAPRLATAPGRAKARRRRRACRQTRAAPPSPSAEISFWRGCACGSCAASRAGATAVPRKRAIAGRSATRRARTARARRSLRRPIRAKNRDATAAPPNRSDRRSEPSRISRASTPAREAASGAPPESSISTFQRSNSARTRSASPRSGVTSAAVRPSRLQAPRAGRRQWPAPPRVRRRPRSAHTGKRRFDRAWPCCGAPARPKVGGVGGTKSLRGECVARGQRAGASPERYDVRAHTSDGFDQPREKGLRMGGAGLVPALDRGERSRHRDAGRAPAAPRAPCLARGDRRQQPRRDDIRAGRADGDDGICFTRDIFDRARDQRLLPRAPDRRSRARC